MEPETLVIFRKFRKGGDIIALFPELEHSEGGCESYQHVGQHGGANYHALVSGHNQWSTPTLPARPNEYADLKAELESIGYKLKVRTKWIRRHR